MRNEEILFWPWKRGLCKPWKRWKCESVVSCFCSSFLPWIINIPPSDPRTTLPFHKLEDPAIAVYFQGFFWSPGNSAASINQTSGGMDNGLACYVHNKIFICVLLAAQNLSVEVSSGKQVCGMSRRNPPKICKLPVATSTVDAGHLTSLPVRSIADGFTSYPHFWHGRDLPLSLRVSCPVWPAGGVCTF